MSTAGRRGAALAALLLCTSGAVASDCPELRVEGVRPGEGTLRIAVFDSAATFRKTPVYARTLPAGGAATHREALCGVTGAEFAVVVTQDVNDNGRLDTNLVGIPKEPWGASGRRTLGPPSWSSARVTPGTATVVVQLR